MRPGPGVVVTAVNTLPTYGPDNQPGEWHVTVQASNEGRSLTDDDHHLGNRSRTREQHLPAQPDQLVDAAAAPARAWHHGELPYAGRRDPRDIKRTRSSV
jgi:hypothetical protein